MSVLIFGRNRGKETGVSSYFRKEPVSVLIFDLQSRRLWHGRNRGKETGVSSYFRPPKQTALARKEPVSVLIFDLQSRRLWCQAEKRPRSSRILAPLVAVIHPRFSDNRTIGATGWIEQLQAVAGDHVLV